MDITYEDGMIACEKLVKYLGIIINETRSFLSHIETLSRILSRDLGMIRKLKCIFLTIFLGFSIFH